MGVGPLKKVSGSSISLSFPHKKKSDHKINMMMKTTNDVDTLILNSIHSPNGKDQQQQQQKKIVTKDPLKNLIPDQISFHIV